MTASGKAKILLVDDNRDFLKVMDSILTDLGGYEVVSLEDATRTLETVRAEQPDVIVLDIYMPTLNGPQVCRQLKATPELRHIPVLFLTAVGSDARFRARCLEGGGDDFLEKPVSSEELIARLRVLLRIKQLQDELRRERDDLERKAEERARELKRSETLAAIGQMVAGVAHEIRNPLGAISNSAAVLSRDLVLEGEDRKLMQIIVGEAERLRKTINEFLTFAHPPPCCFAPTDLSRLIEDVLFLARRDSLCDDRVEFSIRIEPELPPVPVDRDRLQQVLWNLVRNSLEAMKGKGCIVIEVARQAQDGIPGILIRVADDGPGIPAEDREQVFEPFFTRKTRGSGLGLALVHAAAKAHGGSIRLREAAPAGCCFDLWLPLAQEAQARGMA